MRSLSLALVTSLTVITIGCGDDSSSHPSSLEPDAVSSVVGHDAFAWSEPVWLGPVVNSTARDWMPVLSTDGLALYFHSDRAGGLGSMDLWVSRRAHPQAPWEPPVNLGPPLNTSAGDGDAAFTPDGRTMFFSSEGHGGSGNGDLYVTHRSDPDDDFSWQPPVNLGPDVNTAAHESTPAFVQNEAGGTLYFTRSTGGPPTADIYKVRVTRDGHVLGSAVLVEELSDPVIGDQAMTVRADGRELIFWSGGRAGSRPGTIGLADLWVSHRRSVNDPWSEPANLGVPVNTPFAELSATLAHDGRALFLTTNRPGGLGRQDMWMSTRSARGN